MNSKMKKPMLGLIAALVLTMLSGLSFATDNPANVTAEEALTMLIEGNSRFVDGELGNKDLGDARRKELTKGQTPFATIIGCSDSRVPPELVFDQGLGELFVIRVAGNIVDKIELGSVEYAAEHLSVPLIMVLGHKSCGAVTASLPEGESHGNIGAIIDAIKPAVDSAKKIVEDDNDLLNASIEGNARNTAIALTEKSPVIKHLVDAGKVKIVVGVYDLSTGKVVLLD